MVNVARLNHGVSGALVQVLGLVCTGLHGIPSYHFISEPWLYSPTEQGKLMVCKIIIFLPLQHQDSVLQVSSKFIRTSIFSHYKLTTLFFPDSQLVIVVSELVHDLHII